MGNTEGALNPDPVSTKQARIAELAMKNPSMAFTSLNHHLDVQLLRRAFELTRKDGAVGIDGQSATEYEKNLGKNLECLLGRIKSGSYKAPPVRRAYIPKVDGSQRPLGIPTFEDKVAQRAIVLLLEPIYEHDFLPCSYGFRPGHSAHQALQDLRTSIMTCGGRWVLDVDLRRYFDTIDHGHLRQFLDRRVTDGVIRRMIDKWLKAGVLEADAIKRSDVGTPQGGVISPLLANIYLHYVLDEWFARDVEPRMKARCALVRYADDFVMVFEDFLDCERVQRVLSKRMEKYGLALHVEKTKRVDFRFKRRKGERHPATQATTFDFLGFTHVWGKSARGKSVVYQRTAKDRFARALKKVTDWCRRNIHLSIRDQRKRLARMMNGHYAYFGITGNSRRIRWYAHHVERIWFSWLRRRSRGGRGGYQMFDALLRRYPLPKPLVVHRYAAASEPVT
jgi:group II intron reverse transcriptase/maturase